MITAVVDTNVLASGLVRREPPSPPVRVLEAWRADLYILVASDHILAELARTLQEPYFRDRLTPQQISNGLAVVRDETARISITAQIHGIATHPEDDLILATAVSAKADYLVTGDVRLRRLRSYQGVTIVSPREFLDILERQRPS